MKKVAVIGTGISGLTVGRVLHKSCELKVFEAANYIGGHTNTISLGPDHGGLKIDTGFIVFNDWTYPNFIRLLTAAGVESQPSSMSFSVTCEKSGLEYNGSTISSLFAQRRNVFNLKFLRLIADILSFNRDAEAFLKREDHATTLGDFLEDHRFSELFKTHFIMPMGAAIWSSGLRAMRDFPARYFMEFFKNHGMLSVNNRPQWRVIKGGSQSYIDPITSGWKQHISLNTPVRKVWRTDRDVRLQVHGDDHEQVFDEVVMACHSDQALAILSDASDKEQEILRCFSYTPNRAVLHTDEKILPRSNRAWAAWNYRLPKSSTRDVATVTYNMNILQGLSAAQTNGRTYCVTLNPEAHAIAPESILREIDYHHPAYTLKAVTAQKRHAEVSGRNRVHFCGAYWGYGFHEDGVNSALRVTNNSFGRGLDA